MTKIPMYRTVARRVDGEWQCADSSDREMSISRAADAMQGKYGCIPGPGSGNGLLVPLADAVTFETFEL